MEGIPICNKPNCRHISWKEDRNTKCDAANIDISTVFPYEGKLYGFRSLSDGGSELVVSDLDGGDWKSKGMFITAEEIFKQGLSWEIRCFFKGCSGKTRRSYHRNENGYSNVRIEF